MNILVVGSGAREHALTWKLAQSPKASRLLCIPGNPGMAQTAECVSSIRADDVAAVADFAAAGRMDLTVVGPEQPLALGLVDELRRRNLPVIGPTQAAARLETSKSFAKSVMSRARVPTARAKTFETADKARGYIQKATLPMVVKADGLAAGKGVVIAQTREEALEAADEMFRGRFGEAGSRVVVEEFLQGDEASYFVLSDGKNFADFGTSQDHKRVFDADTGPNTGGMGAYSPAYGLSPEDCEQVRRKVIVPTLRRMAALECPYTGFLYAGLMLSPDGVKVLEFNARMGDPETQVVLPRLKTDLVDVFEALLSGSVQTLKLDWDPRPAVTVVMASGGYPGEFKKGFPITGLDEVKAMEDVTVFHAGTRMENGKLVTSGGRVLSVTALGRDVTEAASRAYAAVAKIRFEGAHHRNDIAYRAIRFSPPR